MIVWNERIRELAERLDYDHTEGRAFGLMLGKVFVGVIVGVRR